MTATPAGPSRRRVAAGLGLGAMAAASGLAPAARAATSRGNILVVLTDQEQFPRHLPPLNLPNRARFAGNALTFTHEFVANPVCSPSRGVTWTGLYPHKSGVIENVDESKNGPPLNPRIPTIGSVLGSAGYKTAYFGKWHLGPDDELPKHGFAHAFVPPNNGDAKAADNEIVRRAAAWIRSAPEPWLAVVCITNPHDIAFPENYADLKMPDYPITLPPSVHEDLTASPIPELRDYAKVARRRGVPTDDTWRQYVRFYSYLIETSDRSLGTVLDGLDASGARDRTTIVYTSDHGEMAAAHGLRQKRFMYEDSVRVPLIISDPRRFKSPRTIDSLTSNIDIAPTIAGLAGVAWPTPLPGRDLLAGGRRDAVFSMSNLAPLVLPKRVEELTQMVRTEQWKLVVYPSGAQQLFDMVNDPYELNDRGADPALAGVRSDLKRRLGQEFA